VKLDFYVIWIEYFEVGFTVSLAKIEIQKTGSLRAGIWRVKMLSTFLPLLLLCDFHGKLSAPPPPAVGLAALARGLGFVVPRCPKARHLGHPASVVVFTFHPRHLRWGWRPSAGRDWGSWFPPFEALAKLGQNAHECGRSRKSR
jgi:hypothetical protein